MLVTPKAKAWFPSTAPDSAQQPLSQRARFREVVELSRWAEDVGYDAFGRDHATPTISATNVST
ncbi:hypothetical protein OG308_23470 [Nocardia salmonicida]|uniref:LLM class flavin-dependent oxidoreductase n=1 Tax=Nocardia salmonicida TaxID=53431 RepID=A0ABZ1N2S9_9NOCA